jgi:hypothetical protein
MNMATVWAFREGKFIVKPSSGWTHSIEFGTDKHPPIMQGSRDYGTSDLIEQLENVHLRVAVERLDIVAHGDPGRVFMSGPDRRWALPQHFRDLSPYLKSGAMLVFASCRAGVGPDGDMFLMAVSDSLPHRVIVGYDSWGWFSPVAPSDPGQVCASTTQGNPGPGAPLLTPWGEHAKWAYQGKIVRFPAGEQKLYRNKHCANPACRGHASESDRCPYASWGSDAILRAYNP